MKPIRIAYATLAYFTITAVTTPPKVTPKPPKKSRAIKKESLCWTDLRSVSQWSNGANCL